MAKSYGAVDVGMFLIILDKVKYFFAALSCFHMKPFMISRIPGSGISGGKTKILYCEHFLPYYPHLVLIKWYFDSVS